MTSIAGRLILIGALASLAGTASAEDYYEPNDGPGSAYDLSWYEGYWLSEVAGYGEQWDDDWYRVYVDYGYERLVLDLRYDASWGDVDIEVYDSYGWRVARSTTGSDDEYLEVIVPSSGEYFVRVHWSDRGNDYDLWWDDLPHDPWWDDAYEYNDSRSSAFDLSSFEGWWLSDIAGRARQSDDDWYLIYVPHGSDSLDVDLRFDHQAGDIDLEVYGPGGELVTRAQSSSDDERLTIHSPRPGYHTLRVYYDDDGNTYDMYWRTWRRPSGGSPVHRDEVYGGGSSGPMLLVLLTLMLGTRWLRSGVLLTSGHPIEGPSSVGRAARRETRCSGS